MKNESSLCAVPLLQIESGVEFSTKPKWDQTTGRDCFLLQPTDEPQVLLMKIHEGELAENPLAYR